MTPQRWQQIDALYAAYLEQSLAEQQAFLDEASAHDADLRNELKSLLNAHDIPFFDGDPADLLPAAGDTLLPEGTPVGVYRIDRPIGRGGMGQVYRAERLAPFSQTVALKVIRRGLDTEDVLRRFEAERQILANLSHPNIARLLDGGALPDGRPYLVMEYIEGQPITRFCNTYRLTLSQRLVLFQQVCRAVHSAHQNLVIHRDLKPENILVVPAASGAPADAEVKLLDFGIAKLLDPEQDAPPLTRTHAALRLMTPAYASPEQVLGQTVTTASDVYALGVLLYELLTGCRPYQLRGLSRTEIEQVIATKEPVPPSACAEGEENDAISPDWLRLRLRGDLDNIVLKALRKQPSRRYASAQALSEDIRRHLAGLPVEAQPDTLAYRARTFVRRHRWGVTAVAAFVVLLVGFSVVTAWQVQAVQQQAAHLAMERDKAEEVVEYVVELFETADPMRSNETTLAAHDLLERGAARITNELSNQPAVQARMLEVVGRAYRNLGRYQEAEALTRQALALRRTLPGAVEPDVVSSLLALALVRRSQGDINEAVSLLEEAHLLSTQRLGAAHPLTLKAMVTLAHVLLEDKGKEDTAETLLREALALQRQTLAPDDKSLAVTLNSLAGLLRRQRAFDEAKPLLQEALRIKRIHYPENHIQLAAQLNSLAMLHTVTGAFHEAEAGYTEAIAIYRDQLGDEHPHVATVLFNLGRTKLSREDYPAAEEVLRDVLARHRNHYGPDDHRVAAVALQLGRVLHKSGQLGEAETLLREAIQIRTQVLGGDNWQTAYAQAALGKCLTDQGQYDAAEALLVQAHATMQHERGEEHRMTRQVKDALTQLHAVQENASTIALR